MAKDTIKSLITEMKKVNEEMTMYSVFLFEKRVVRFLKAFAIDTELFQSDRDVKVAQKLVTAIELRKIATDEKFKSSLTCMICDLLDILDF